MGLLVAHHLDPVLDVAQEPVGGYQLLAGFFIDPFGSHQRPQHRLGRLQPQLGRAPAGDQLLRLDEELDLADAAAAKLDVMAFHGDFAMALVRMDLALDRMDVGNRRIVEIFAEDERRQFAQECIPGGKITCNRARLDEGGAFPVLAPALIIEHRRLDRDGQRGRTRIGSQPQVGAEHIAVAGAFLQDADQPAQQSGKGLRGLVRIGNECRLRIVEDDEIDVGRIVELEGAELSHAENHDAGGSARIGRVRDGELAGVMGA